MNKDQTVDIRWHGRGGQGAVTSAELLALAAIAEGKYVQAFPSFGPERRGAPVLAFNRISESSHIRTRSAVTEPDIVVVLDSSLLHIADVLSGLKTGGALIVNTPKSLDEIKAEFGGPWKLAVIDATSIARKELGVPIVNTTMLGALIKTTSIIKFESLEEPLIERFGPRAQSNIAVCQRAYEETEIAEPMKKALKRLIASDKLPGWKDILPGCVVVTAGSACQYRTGDWKSQHTEWDNSKCTKCGLCYIYCPEGCIEPIKDGYYKANNYYCKGCGICANECPKEVITMVEEV